MPRPGIFCHDLLNGGVDPVQVVEEALRKA